MWVKGQGDVILSDNMTKSLRERRSTREGDNFSEVWGAIMTQCWTEHTHTCLQYTHTHTVRTLYTSPNLAANNKALSETFMTFINKSR